MPLSEEDRRRIEEEEYRKVARERLERTVRLEADVRTVGDQRLEVRGVSTEIYRDAKSVLAVIARIVALAAQLALLGFIILVSIFAYDANAEWNNAAGAYLNPMRGWSYALLVGSILFSAWLFLGYWVFRWAFRRR